MEISVGLLGFGKTGRAVARELLKDTFCNLQWVLRESNRHEGEYASRHLGYEFDRGKIYCINNLNLE